MSGGESWASAAQLAYPLGDLLLMGFAVVLWGAGGWRIDAWFGLAAAFALIAMSDAIYVAAQTGGGWTPGTLQRPRLRRRLAADRRRRLGLARRTAGEASPTARVALPIAFTVAAFVLVVYEAFADLDAVAVALIRLTLLAVVVRLGLTLWWLSRQRADLEALAASDPLTGLGNYRAFQEHLQRAVGRRRTTRSALIVLDLDHFKVLNDTFGHAEGDRVLQATATTLSRTVGEAGFVARVGGEEFAIALSGARRGGRGRGRRALPRRARRARVGRHAAGLLGGRRLLPGPRRRRRAAAARRRRRALLGQALGPRPRARVRPAPRRGAVARRAAPRGRGGARDAPGAVAPVFQPVMEVATGRVAGYEALARFAPPVRAPAADVVRAGAPLRPRPRARGVRDPRRARRARPPGRHVPGAQRVAGRAALAGGQARAARSTSTAS